MAWGTEINTVRTRSSKRSALLRFLLPGLFLAAAVYQGAAAQESPDQDVSPNISVSDRFAANFRPEGRQTGGFTLFPSASLDGIYDNNIFRVEDDKESDFIASIAAAMRAESNWSRHQLLLDARVNRLQYVDYKEESTTEYIAGAAGRLDFGSRSFLRLRSSYGRYTEPRSTAQTALGAVKPVQFDSINAGADLLMRQTKMRQAIGFDYRKDDFKDAFTAAGEEIDQDFRDRGTYTAYGRLFLRVRPAVEVFAEARGQKVVFNSQQLPIGAVQDSTGYTLAGGVAFDINKVARGEIGVGYTERDFKDPVFTDIKGLNVAAELEYFMSDLTTVTIAAERSIQDAAVLGAAGYWANGVRATVEHELIRSVLLVASAEYRLDQFRGLDREDRYYRASAGVDYAFRREIVFGLRYTHSNLSSDGALAREGFSGDVIRLGVNVRF